MPQYRYKAVSPAGVIAEGDMLAPGRAEAVARIQGLGQVPIQVQEIVGGGLSALLGKDLFGARKPSRRMLAAFIRQFGTLLRAGLPLDRTLEILFEVAGRPAEAEVPRRLLQKIRGGSALADAMAADPLFPPFCVSMVRSGEIAGSLDAVLDRLADFLDKSEAARAKIKSALVYPAIVMIACTMSLVLLFAFVVPRFRPFFEEAHAKLPASTKVLLVLGDFFQHFWWLPPAILLVAIPGAIGLLRQPAYRRHWDGVLLRLPVLGDLVRKVEVAQFSHILGTMLKNGVPLPNALRIAGETLRNSVLAKAIAGVGAGMKEGKGLTEPLQVARIFPPLAMRLVRVGEEAARLDDMLLDLAAIYRRETEAGTERLITIIGPALTIGMGLVVAAVIGSIITAILSVYRLAI